MTTLHLHLGDKDTQKECLKSIGNTPGAIFTMNRYLRNLPNLPVMMQKILDTEVFGLIIEKGMDQTTCSFLLEIIQKREAEGKKTLIITSKGNLLPKAFSSFFVGSSTECGSVEECTQVLEMFLEKSEKKEGQ